MNAWPAADRPKTHKVVGITGSGMIGRDPFDRKAWSSSSYHFFTELQNQQALHRAFGVEAPAVKRYFYMARNFHRNREVWRNHFYLDLSYRQCLTQRIQGRLEEADFEHPFLQLGAMYDVPALLNGRSRCYSYHDGNVAEWARSPYVPKGLDARRIDRAMAYEKRVYDGMTTIFTMSEYLRQSFLRDFDQPPERVRAIGAGINLELLPEYLPNKDYGTQAILFIGVDFPRKGGRELLQAFRGVRERLPKSTLHLVGPKVLQIPPGQERGVVCHGFLSKNDPKQRAQLEDLFRRCCLFVMPSLYEPFGIAPLEAMTHQLPCLVTNKWALRETVIPGETGDWVECGSIDDLEFGLIDLLSDPDRLQRMGTTARARVLEYYTWDKVVGRLLDCTDDHESSVQHHTCQAPVDRA